MFGIAFDYDDEWILEHWDKVRNWAVLLRMYNEEHGTNFKYTTFKSHCNRELGLNYLYSDEEISWIIENYPKLGRVKATEEFNKIFSYKRTENAIHKCAVKLGLKVTKERLKEKAIENTGRYHPIGTIINKGKSWGVCIKTEEGWKRLSDLAIGKAPKGYRTVHLDGDITNNHPDNLMHVDFASCALMTRYDFWSSSPLITKTGIVWTDCYKELLRKER